MASSMNSVMSMAAASIAFGIPLVFRALPMPEFNILAQYLQTVAIVCVASGTLYAYYHNLPLSHTVYKQKTKLVLARISQFSQGMVFDIWIVIIIVLVVAWIIGINDGIIGIWFIWCCIFWIYSLEEDEPEVVSAWTGDSAKPSISSTPSLRLPSGIDLEQFLLTLEGRVRRLEKSHSDLASDKVQQNIALYTFDHQLSLRIQTLEELFSAKESTQQTQMENVAQAVHNVVNRKRNRFEIIKMYIITMAKLSYKWNKLILKNTLPKRVYQSIKVSYHYETNRWIMVYQKLRHMERTAYTLIRRFQRQ